MPEFPDESVQVQVHWPAETYARSTPTNIFVVTDSGEQVYISFGFLPPPPNIGELREQTEAGSQLHFTVNQSTSFVMSRPTLLTVHRELTDFINRNSHIYGDLQPDDAEYASDSNAADS